MVLRDERSRFVIAKYTDRLPLASCSVRTVCLTTSVFSRTTMASANGGRLVLAEMGPYTLNSL
jgi:hypothetical protein